MIPIILCSIFFIIQEPFQQILDYKFINVKGLALIMDKVEKGLEDTIKILEDNNKEITFNSKNYIFKSGEKVMLIIGVHFNQVIGFYKVL